MQKKISKLPFRGTAEQEKKLREVIDANKHDKSLLMAVMQHALTTDNKEVKKKLNDARDELFRHLNLKAGLLEFVEEYGGRRVVFVFHYGYYGYVCIYRGKFYRTT